MRGEIKREKARIRYNKIRFIALKNFGNKCKICGTDKKLQLHHRYYAKNSIRSKVHNENGSMTIKRTQEAILYPGRFNVLCLSCHNSVHPKRKKIISLALFEEILGR